MSNVDNLIAAQKRVQALAEELEKVKNAAELFDSAEEKQRAVIRASDAIVEHAGDFASEGQAVIEEFQKMNLGQQLGDLNRSLKEMEQLLERQLERLNSFLSDLKDNNHELIRESSKVSKQLQTETGALKESLRSTGEKISKELAEVKRDQETVAQKYRAFREEQKENHSTLRYMQITTLSLVALAVLLLLGSYFV